MSKIYAITDGYNLAEIVPVSVNLTGFTVQQEVRTGLAVVGEAYQLIATADIEGVVDAEVIMDGVDVTDDVVTTTSTKLSVDISKVTGTIAITATATPT